MIKNAVFVSIESALSVGLDEHFYLNNDEIFFLLSSTWNCEYFIARLESFDSVSVVTSFAILSDRSNGRFKCIRGAFFGRVHLF